MHKISLVLLLLSTLLLASQCRAFECPKGQYWNSWTNYCDLCVVGNYCPGDDTAYSCPQGTFSDQSGAISCSPCPAGTHTDRWGTITCYICKPGTFAAHEGSINCAPCPSGSFSDHERSTNCTSCASRTSSSDRSYCILIDTPKNAVQLYMAQTVTIPADGVYYYISIRKTDYPSNNNSLILSFKTGNEIMLFGSKQTGKPSPTSYMFHTVGKNPSIYDPKRGTEESEVYYFVMHPSTNNVKLSSEVIPYITGFYNIPASSHIDGVKCLYKENLVLFSVNNQFIPTGGKKIRIKFTLISPSGGSYNLYYSSTGLASPVNYESIRINETDSVSMDVDYPRSGEPLGFSFFSNNISWTVGFNIDLVAI